MIASWQTTAVGITALIVGSVLLYLGKINWDQYMLFLGIFGLGLTAKDHNVTGGDRKQ